MRPPRRSDLVVAWTGAVLFAASLAWFVYAYLVRFGRPAPPGAVVAPVLVDLLLFSVFALHHSVLARSGAKETVRRIVPAELERSLYTWVSSLLFLGVCTWWQPVPGVLYRLDGAWRFGAWAVQLLGILLTLRCVERARRAGTCWRSPCSALTRGRSLSPAHRRATGGGRAPAAHHPRALTALCATLCISPGHSSSSPLRR